MSDAPKGSAPTRTLARAAKTLGGAPALAKRLNVALADLERWMAGEALPPHEVFLEALDIVAAGPRRDPAGRGQKAERADPQGSSGQFRQVQPKDGAPASNKPDAAEDKKSKG